jgi:hypothetical protein
VPNNTKKNALHKFFPDSSQELENFLYLAIAIGLWHGKARA